MLLSKIARLLFDCWLCRPALEQPVQTQQVHPLHQHAVKVVQPNQQRQQGDPEAPGYQCAEQADRCAKAVNLGVLDQLPVQKLQIFQRAAAQKIVVGVRFTAQTVIAELDPD